MPALLVALFLLLLPGPLWAHAQLRAADPPPGAILDRSPAEVRLTFNESIAPLAVHWFAPDGTRHTALAQALGPDLIVTPPADLPPGTQALSWRVTSEDGHPVGGTHLFSIGHATPAPEAIGAPLAWPAALARALVTLTLAFGVGGVLWAALSGGPAPLARALAMAALPAAGLLLAAQALDLAGGRIAALAEGASWAAAAASPYGPAAALAGLAGVVAAGARGARGLALAAWGLAALSFAVAGHAARAEPPALMGPLMAVHAAAAIFWAGALPGLAAVLSGSGPVEAVARFGRLAVPAVALLAAAGAALALRQIGDPAALASTAYGAVFLGKMALVAAVLALAVRHRLVLTPRLRRDPAGTRRAFARSIRLELALMAALLALTAAFRLTPPPRALTAPVETRAEQHLHGRAAMADVALIPGRAGPNRVELVPLDPDFRPFAPLEAVLILAQPAAGIEPIRLRLEPGPDGIWRAGPVHLPRPGDWEVVADLLITDFRKELLGGGLTLRP